MSLPLFLVEELPAGESYTLDGPEGHHAQAVQRLRPGERLVLGNGCGGTAVAVVEAVGRGSLDVMVETRRYTEPPDPRLVVVQGIAKGERGELAVQAMTEVGVDEIVPWAAARSVAVWRGERGERSLERWRATAREAAKQARRSWLPTVATPVTTGAVAGRVTLVLHEEAEQPLSAVPLPPAGEVVLAVGPEGGVAPEEVAAFEQAGAVPVRLGDTVLRTSTAGVAALAVLNARLGRW
ncbi:MAG TPA: 16S rRNA (uracil(1498)-N(3))-methyltransferase [Micromonosporaceae bacterium]